MANLHFLRSASFSESICFHNSCLFNALFQFHSKISLILCSYLWPMWFASVPAFMWKFCSHSNSGQRWMGSKSHLSVAVGGRTVILYFQLLLKMLIFIVGFLCSCGKWWMQLPKPTEYFEIHSLRPLSFSSCTTLLFLTFRYLIVSVIFSLSCVYWSLFFNKGLCEDIIP